MGFQVGGTYAIPDVSQSSANLRTYTGEPSTGKIGAFGNFAKDVANFGVQTLVRVGKSALTGGAGGATGYGNAGDNLQGLLEQQIEIQAEMQAFTMATNIEHTKHETKMSAIRNMRVG